MNQTKNINNTYEQEVMVDSMASKKAIKMIKDLTAEEAKALLLDFYTEAERKLRSLAFKQLEDSVKRIKGG